MVGEELVFVLVLASIFVAVVVPVWVYSDAERNSPHSPLLWALVVFVGGLVGISLYFVLGRETSRSAGYR